MKGSFARLTSIGRTFLDTVREPSLCGGINHVLDIWQDHAKLSIDDIIETVDRVPSKIVQPRAGYILDEVLGINDSRFLS